MCHKCHYITVDGVTAHVNGDFDKMTPETLDALKSLIKIARNYSDMKAKEKDLSRFTKEVVPDNKTPDIK